MTPSPIASAGGICPACLMARGIAPSDNNFDISEMPTLGTDANEIPITGSTSGSPQSTPSSFASPGTKIGPYLLVSELGEGGFGSVFLAEQEKPVKRKVALKLIKPGMDSREIVARFEAERQALALMDHPHIAHVYDAGTTDRGMPYFVMELVDGMPITKYCDEKKLTVRERLRIFLQVCAGVQHAHQKGIVHRDLKPANILVAEVDDQAIAKVIDFGIAKALHAELTEQTLLTAEGQMIGTPQYMSPEQVDGDPADVDMRCDIFSLGIILYELLIGEPPIPYQEFLKAGLGEVIRLICEKDAPRASVCIRRCKEKASTVAETRATGVRRLLKTIRGDLDCIMQKAVEKDRDRRYDSISAFAGDVQRFLENETVTARPPTWGYRFRKYARRHKGQAAAAIAVLGTLMLGIVASSWFAWQSIQDAERARVAELKERFGREATSALQMAPSSPQKALTSLDAVVRGWEARFGSEEKFSSPVIAALSQVPELCRETASFPLMQTPVGMAVSQDQKSFLIGYSGDGDGDPPPSIAWQSFIGDGKIDHRIAGSAPLTSLITVTDNEIAGGFRDGSIKLVSLENGQVQQAWNTSETKSPIRALAFAGENKIIVSLDNAGSVTRWNLSGEKIGNSVSLGTGFYDQITVSADATMAVVADSLGKEKGLTTVRYHDDNGTIETRETPGTRVSSVLINRDGSQIVTGHIDGQIHFRDASGQSNDFPIIAHRAPIVTLGWIGPNVASAARDGVIRTWTPDGTPLSPELKGHKVVVALAGVMNDRYLLSLGRDRSARAWDLDGVQIRSPIPISSSTEELEFVGKNGHLLVGAMSDETLTSWDWAKGKQVAQASVGRGKPVDLSVSADGQRISCVSQNEGSVRLFRSENLEQIATIKVEGEKLLASTFHSDPRKIFAYAQSGNLFSASAQSDWKAEKIGSFPKPQGPLDFCFVRWIESRQNLLVAGGIDQPFLVTGNGEIVALMKEKPGHHRYRDGVIWSDDQRDGGLHFLFGHTSGKSLDFARAQGKSFSLLHSPPIFPVDDMVEAIGLVPASGIIGISTVTGRLALINRDLELISPATRPHRGKIDAVAAHPSLQILATGGHDSAIRFWAAGPDSWRALLESRLDSTLESASEVTFFPAKRKVTASAEGVHFEAAGLTIPAHPDWKPVSQAMLNTGYEIFVRAVGDDFRRARIRAVYDLKGDSGGGETIFFGNQLLIGEVPEFNRPEYYAPKLSQHINHTFDAINRHLSSTIMVNRKKVEIDWVGEPGLCRATGELIYGSGKRAKVVGYVFPVDGATVGAVAIVHKDDPKAAEILLHQVETQLLSAVVRPENRLDENRLAAIKSESEHQAILNWFANNGEKEIRNRVGAWIDLRNRNDPQSRTELTTVSREIIDLTDRVLTRSKKSWGDREKWEILRNRQGIRHGISLGLNGQKDQAREMIDQGLTAIRQRWEKKPTSKICESLIDALKDLGAYQRDVEDPLPDQIAILSEIIELCEEHNEHTRGDQKMSDLIYHVYQRAQLYSLEENGSEKAVAGALDALERWKNWDKVRTAANRNWEMPRDICGFLSEVARKEKQSLEALKWARQSLEFSRKHAEYHNSRAALARVSELMWRVANREQDHAGKPNQVALDLGRESIEILKDLDKKIPLMDGTRKNLEGRIKTLQSWEAMGNDI